jgi:hypothetical protein
MISLVPWSRSSTGVKLKVDAAGAQLGGQHVAGSRSLCRARPGRCPTGRPGVTHRRQHGEAVTEALHAAALVVDGDRQRRDCRSAWISKVSSRSCGERLEIALEQDDAADQRMAGRSRSSSVRRGPSRSSMSGPSGRETVMAGPRLPPRRRPRRCRCSSLRLRWACRPRACIQSAAAARIRSCGRPSRRWLTAMLCSVAGIAHAGAESLAERLLGGKALGQKGGRPGLPGGSLPSRRAPAAWPAVRSPCAASIRSMRAMATMSVPTPWIMRRASSISCFMRRTASCQPQKTASATMAWPMFSSTISGNGGHRLDVLVVQAVAGIEAQPVGVSPPRQRGSSPAQPAPISASALSASA